MSDSDSDCSLDDDVPPTFIFNPITSLEQQIVSYLEIFQFEMFKLNSKFTFKHNTILPQCIFLLNKLIV